MAKNDLIFQQVRAEQTQGHPTRKTLYIRMEKLLNLPVLSFFTSFRYPVMIEDSDVDMLEGILQKTDLSKGLTLFLSSPGGDGLAAERIVNLLRSYSGTKHYEVIVPGKAKSAATMICLGGSKIIMGVSSELGTIDPQKVVEEEGQVKWFSVFHVVKSYDDLFAKAVKTKGNLQPYLQQLANYDAREIEQDRAALLLSKDIAVKILKTGILSHFSKETIEKKISIFLTPESVKVHGRPIFPKDVEACDLKIDLKDAKDPIWPISYELYSRLNNFVSMNSVAKCIETKDYCFTASFKG